MSLDITVSLFVCVLSEKHLHFRAENACHLLPYHTHLPSVLQFLCRSRLRSLCCLGHGLVWERDDLRRSNIIVIFEKSEERGI